MYALSLYQPWASLILLNEKEFETRSFNCKHRGPLLIHASKRSDDLKEVFRSRNLYREVLAKHGLDQIAQFHLGHALGIVDVVDRLPTEQVRDYISSQEKAFGNYNDKRFAWRLANIRCFESPIPMRGEQGLFVIQNPDVHAAVREQMIIWHEVHGQGVERCPECDRVAATGQPIRHAAGCSQAEKEAQP